MARDKNTQFRNLNVTETAANTFTQAEFEILSIERMEVMEILKLIIDVEEPTLENAVINEVKWQLTKNSQGGSLSFAHDDVIMQGRETVNSIDTATTDTTLVTQNSRPQHVIDLTDGNGNGYISPKSSIFLAVEGSGNATTKFVNIKILFTWTKITVNELVDFLREN